MSSQPQEAPPQDAQAPSRPRWGWILVWAALLGLLTLLFFGLQRTQQGPVEIGNKAPDFDLTTFDGQVIRLAELKGKVVVLNFWLRGANPVKAKLPTWKLPGSTTSRAAMLYSWAWIGQTPRRKPSNI